jgi:hypothetical protein
MLFQGPMQAVEVVGTVVEGVDRGSRQHTVGHAAYNALTNAYDPNMLQDHRNSLDSPRRPYFGTCSHFKLFWWSLPQIHETQFLPTAESWLLTIPVDPAGANLPAPVAIHRRWSIASR